MRIDKLLHLQWKTIVLILDLLPEVEFSPYVHELFFHAAQVIGKKIDLKLNK